MKHYLRMSLPTQRVGNKLNVTFLTTWTVMFVISWCIWVTIIYRITKQFL